MACRASPDSFRPISYAMQRNSRTEILKKENSKQEEPVIDNEAIGEYAVAHGLIHFSSPNVLPVHMKEKS